MILYEFNSMKFSFLCRSDQVVRSGRHKGCKFRPFGSTETVVWLSGGSYIFQPDICKKKKISEYPSPSNIKSSNKVNWDKHSRLHTHTHTPTPHPHHTPPTHTQNQFIFPPSWVLLNQNQNLPPLLKHSWILKLGSDRMMWSNKTTRGRVKRTQEICPYHDKKK